MSFCGDSWTFTVSDEIAKLANKDRTRDILCGFRPEHLLPGNGDFIGRVTAAEMIGDAIYIQVRIPTNKDHAQFAVGRRHIDLRPPNLEEVISLTLDTRHLHWFDPESGNRL